ncbi:ArsC family reductase [Kordiimonas lacus]|uniref:Transcriptional regulator, Spx/MgsR family n=1 Tax=Kordiimonas lacus TaxID=637679 RepID=A0A1G7B1D9_9PROT|nr:ArsC family reductase [Kordiimonas lacus]SDE20667.1 transcriptional regulator, Spx/MgsR family [Kordiimonas lacus]
MLTIYGIKNCDTVKKARKWLEAEGVDHRFHDFRADGLDDALMARFVDALGWEALLNTRGTTWRKLPDVDRTGVDAQKAAALMVANEALVKRPVWEKGGDFRLGFAPKEQEAIKAWARA